MKIFSILILCASVFAGPQATQSQRTSFADVKIRFSKSEKDRRLVDKDAVLILDAANRLLMVNAPEKQLSIPYDKVRRVQFEVTTHMRSGFLAELVTVTAAASVGVVGAGAPIAAKRVSDYWCYIEYVDAASKAQSQLLEIEKKVSEQVIEKMTQTFGDRVARIEFKEEASKVEKKSIVDLQSKHDIRVDKTNHPMPGKQAGKALIVVVCPPLAARKAGKGNQFKIHANDRVVIVNKSGTYSFAYLDPGEYMLVSQSDNGSGFRIKLEADQDYYFLQNTLYGMMKPGTLLSRNSKELVMYELNGAYYADWKRKK
jgi:hypothetical protein